MATAFQVLVFIIVCVLWFGSIYYFLYRETEKVKPRVDKNSDDEVEDENEDVVEEDVDSQG